jgi:phosphoribosylamine--glycine ligase
MQAPFLLQEVVEGQEVATEGWFDGYQFHFPNHTLEEKKFMAGGYVPNTGNSGCLMWATNGPSRLFTHGIGRMVEFLREHEYRGMIDLNTIVNQQHVWGLEFTPRFGYDSSATVFSLIKSDFGEFCHSIVTQDGTMDIPLKLRAGWAGSVRYSIPPYPEEVDGRHPRGLPIKGVELDDAWLNWFLYDAMLDGEGLVTAGVNGLIGAPIACGHTPEGAWKGVEAMQEKIHIPDGQARCDIKESTLERLCGLREMGWVE